MVYVSLRFKLKSIAFASANYWTSKVRFSPIILGCNDQIYLETERGPRYKSTLSIAPLWYYLFVALRWEKKMEAAAGGVRVSQLLVLYCIMKLFISIAWNFPSLCHSQCKNQTWHWPDLRELFTGHKHAMMLCTIGPCLHWWSIVLWVAFRFFFCFIAEILRCMTLHSVF